MSELVSDTGLSGIKILKGEVIWSPGLIADGNEAATTVTVSGANMGDYVLVSSSIDAVDLTLVGQVTAAGVVTIQLGNWTGSSVTPTASSTYYVMVLTSP